MKDKIKVGDSRHTFYNYAGILKNKLYDLK